MAEENSNNQSNNTQQSTKKVYHYYVYREKFNYAKYQRFKARQNGFFALASIGLTLVFITFLFRSFINANIEQNISTLLLQILRFFGDNTISNEYLMWTLNNFNDISHWFDGSGIFSFMGDIAEAFGYLANIILLITALLIQAIKMVLLLLNILFVPSV